MGLDKTVKLVEGTMDAGIITDESGSYDVAWKGDRVGLFGADIASARKVLAGKKGQ